MNLSAILTPAFANISALTLKAKCLNSYLIFTPHYITKFNNLEELKFINTTLPLELLDARYFDNLCKISIISCFNQTISD